MLDRLKQHYFIDRDGHMFRYILNFLRTSKLLIPDDFTVSVASGAVPAQGGTSCWVSAGAGERGWPTLTCTRPLCCLQEFSLLYEEACFFQLAPLQSQLQRWRRQRGCRSSWPECLLVHAAPELGEEVSVSAQRAVIQEVFPEVGDLLRPALNSCRNPESTHVSRFPLSSCCGLSWVQVQIPGLGHPWGPPVTLSGSSV